VDVLLLGPQGSGKGTQAKRIAREYDLDHIATGDMLREEIAAGTDLGKRAKVYVDRGDLVPDELMIELIRNAITDRGFVLDGFPRNRVQAEALDDMLRDIGRELDVVFELQISREECIKRLLKRAHEEGRLDDTPEVINRRLEIYYRETEPVIEHYRARGIVVGIHADRSVDEVFAEIQQALERVAA
jgi:adenylate kinase